MFVSGNDRIRVLFPDHLNIARGKLIPHTVASSGRARLCLGVFALTHDRALIPAPGGGLLTGLPDMEMVFDPENLHRSWQSRSKIAIADLEFDGRPLPLCGRSLLKRAIGAWRSKGLEPMIGVEYEANIFERCEDGSWAPYDAAGSYVYGTGPCADPRGVLEHLWEKIDSVGLPIESMNCEFDAGQYELTLHYSDALQAMDDAFLLRLLAREVTHDMGLLMSFMPKPHANMGGSGFHVNFSMNDRGGNNVFADTATEDGLADIARHAVAGLLKHHRALGALLAPLNNSYKRLKPASLSGYWCNWGYDHRGVSVRIPGERGKATRIEHRTADCGSNPYVAAAAILLAAKLGVDNKYPLQAAESGDCFEKTDAKTHLADDLVGSLEALQADEAICQVFGREFIEHFVAIKTAEAEKTKDFDISADFKYYGSYV